MSRINGNVIYHFKKLLLSKYGNEKYEEILNKTSEETRKKLSDVIISGEWYDLNIYHELLDSFVDVLGKEALENIEDELAKTQFTGLFGFFLHLVKPEKVVSKGPAMWRKLYTEGELEIAEFSEKKITIVIDGISLGRGNFISSNAYLRSIIKIVMKPNKITSKPTKVSEHEFVFEYLLE